jgi:hypothetical protein
MALSNYPIQLLSDYKVESGTKRGKKRMQQQMPVETLHVNLFQPRG